MKQIYLLAFLSLVAYCAAQSNPEDEIPVFDVDGYFIVPKMTLSVGVRAMNGPKVAFSGQGVVKSAQDIKDEFADDVVRHYHDGSIFLDAREGATDGKTNNWTYIDHLQEVDNGENLIFNAYSAEILDDQTRSEDAGSTYGVELVVARDMGKIGEKLSWSIFAGVGINSYETKAQGNVEATITTITDKYSLDGQEPSEFVPYSAPSSFTDEFGVIHDTTILLDRKPDSRSTSSVTSDGLVVNQWALKGTYLTMRFGPTFSYLITDDLELSVSVGPTLVYSGATYTVKEVLVVATGEPVLNTKEDASAKAIFGYYVDTTLRYSITDTAGFYVGAFYQTSSDYTQAITESGSSYTALIDLSQLTGFRGGLNFKF